MSVLLGDVFTKMSTAAEKREKKRIENEEKVQKALATLQQVVESNITPRNIRKIVKDAINTLTDPKTPIGIRAANSISILEEVVKIQTCLLSAGSRFGLLSLPLKA